ncbi:protein suppressor 2 of zeste-like [Uranotaenia lowii]|uniref:protein suppressor 2 of zeste-like n=1 Tax=Uranotaenia lowii TaxID=190385 RepID=UPI00247951EA|nr:protein suppressor 2 of zeste-like [Uranotaenia lowii]
MHSTGTGGGSLTLVESATNNTATSTTATDNSRTHSNMVTVSQISRSNRRKVKDFNDSLICSLCNGYFIEATTINDCLHTFCRSCIVRYLESNKYCPKCKSYNNKTITVANLRPDRILKSLVYKLVPGLHRAENQRAAKFYAEQQQQQQHIGKDDLGGNRKAPLAAPDHCYLDDQNFFSPEELISLSLEYHYDSIGDYDPKAQAKLPVTYLCCPAAVTVHHLYKFILTKNGLALGNDRIQVDIIYEDEILPHEFTLMDVAYCFDYKRSSRMRLFYRIFIHPTAKPTGSSTAFNNVGSDKNSNESNNNNNSNNNNSSSNNNNSTSNNNSNNKSGNNRSGSGGTATGKTTDNAEGAEESGGDERRNGANNSSSSSTGDANLNTVSQEKNQELSSSRSIDSGKVAGSGVNGAGDGEVEAAGKRDCKKSNAENVERRSESNEGVNSYTYDSKLIITKSCKAEKGGGSDKKEKESLKLVLVTKKSDKNDSKLVYSKSDVKPGKSPKQSSPSGSVGSSGDFKRLRSNEIRYCEYETTSPVLPKATAPLTGKSGTVPGDDLRKSEPQQAKKHNKINNDYSSSVGDSSNGKKSLEDNSRNKQTTSAEKAENGETKSKHEKSKSSPHHRNESNGAAVNANVTASSSTEKNEKSSELKCYVNLKKQTVVSPLTSSVEMIRKPEVPKLKIELPSLKTKISIPKADSEKSPRTAHSSSTSSSAATSPATSSTASGKSPIWSRPDDSSLKPPEAPRIDIEEYAKTIGLKPVHRSVEQESLAVVKKKKKNSSSSSPDPSFSSSSHRKRKKAKHSKEAGGSKRRKLHAEISSQHDESLKMKVKLTEKPSKHERKPSEEIVTTTNTSTTTSTPMTMTTTSQSPRELNRPIAEVTPSSSSTYSSAPRAANAEDNLKVIDITKGDDDDDVKIIEHPTTQATAATIHGTTLATRVNELPKLPLQSGGSGSTADSSSTKAKINEMRAVRHKPMVYIPNLDKNLSDNSATINSIIQSVQAKAGIVEADNDVQIISSSGLPTKPPTMPSLVPTTRPTTTTTAPSNSMKPPAIKTVMANSARPQQQKPQQVFSPRHTPNYPQLTFTNVAKKVSTTPTNNSSNLAQPRNANPALKRSISVDSNSTYNIPPKTPRVDLMDAQSRLLKKPCYAPMFNFVKGASLAKNGHTNMPTSANDVPFKSPISSAYTKEIGTKKPLPSLLLPPSSISVTKMTDSVPAPAPVDNRPALEIVRIPSTAPVADKPNQKVMATKVTRPPPPTIPLMRIKKSVSVPEQPTTPISPSVFQVTSTSSSSSTNLTTTSASHQDTSAGALDLTTRTNDDLIILESSDSLTPKLNGNDAKPRPRAKTETDAKIEIDSNRLELINSLIQTSAASMIKAGSGMMAKLQNAGIPGLKLPSDMIGFAIANPPNSIGSGPVMSKFSPTTTTSASVTKSMPLPKLTEINRSNRAAAVVRQPNPSVRSIPNPSALAFRNQAASISSNSSLSPPVVSSTLSPTSAAKIANVNMKINSANTTTTPGLKSSNGPLTMMGGAGSRSIAETFSLLMRTTNTGAIGTMGSTITTATAASSNLNGSNNINNNNSISSINKNSDSVSSSTTFGGAPGKKTIEKVAAGLRAAAATATNTGANVANGNRVSSSSSNNNNSNGNGSATGVGANGGLNVV